MVAAALAAAVTVLVSRHVATAQTAPRHGPPVKIDSVTVLRTAVQAGTYVFQRPVYLSPADLASLNRFQDGSPGYDAWFRRRGGVDPGASHVQLVVQGNAAAPVRITNITLLKNCRAPLSGTLFSSPSAGNQGDILINFHLDSPRSVAETSGGQEFFSNYTISLRPGEVQVIQINAVTQRRYCQFRLQLDVLAGTHKTVETITNDGQPFRVTAVYNSDRRYQVVYVGGIANPPSGRFMRQNPTVSSSGR